MESIIVEKIRQLPPELQEEALSFIDFLLTKKIQNGRKNQIWNGLAD